MVAIINGDLPGRAESGVVAPPLVVDVSYWCRVGGAGFGVYLFCCALISTVVSRHFTGRYLNEFGGVFLLMATGSFIGAVPGISRLWIDDEGIRYRAKLFTNRVPWADVTAISEQHRRVGKFSRWGVLVAKRKGGMFIPDVFSIERADLAAVTTQRWRVAVPKLPGDQAPASGGDH